MHASQSHTDPTNPGGRDHAPLPLTVRCSEVARMVYLGMPIRTDAIRTAIEQARRWQAKAALRLNHLDGTPNLKAQAEHRHLTALIELLEARLAYHTAADPEPARPCPACPIREEIEHGLAPLCDGCAKEVAPQ
jgi:hypothetical protein